MDTTRTRKWPFEYKWLVAFTGMLALFTALGLGRFALGMLLPSMGATLELSYAQMGFIGTGNFIGYFVAVFLTRYAVAHFGSRPVICMALLVLGVSMILIGEADGFMQVMLLYCVTGAASGFANVPMVSLVTHWFPPEQRGRAAGIMSIGSGLGIMFSAVVIPLVNDRMGPEGWRTSWLIFGVIGLALSAACLVLLREHSQTYGKTPTPAKAAAASAARPAPTAKAGRWLVPHLGSAYFMFGFTYSIYVTFIVTTLVQERGYTEAVASDFWFWVGVLSMFSGPVFGAVSDWLGRRAGLCLVFALQGLAYVLVAGAFPSYALYLSIGFFGICAWSIPSIMAAAVGDYVGPQQAVKVFGSVTLIFSLGQIMGPALAGVLAEESGGFASSYWLAAGMAGTAVLISAALRKPRVHWE
ncbi:MAG: YbfB/YjiJ family MFS transporter [Rhodospirillaceae bacterium]|nr:YbfB/YjiJ family MFS transporter [Rhodospirillaceae bacterium]